jgi:hypothetical protein
LKSKAKLRSVISVEGYCDSSRRVGIREGVLVEAPSFALSLGVAEFCYKFHSFTLECLAFLATWFVVSSLVRLGSRSWAGHDAD